MSEVETSNSTFSVRKNDFWGYKRADDNIFVFASTLFILQQNSRYLNKEQKVIFEKIESQILAEFAKYQNKDGRLTYNFYKTKPSRHFPNGRFMRRLDHFRLPDDIDDTALIYLTSNYTKEQTIWLKNHLSEFTDQYRGSKNGEIYSTWFGKNMPKEQDVCALLNLMYLLFKHQIALDQTDNNTLKFISNAVNEITKNSFQIARHYGHPALIIYHYARFMADFSYQELDNRKAELIDIAKKLLAKEKSALFRMLLETALLKFGEKRNKIDINLDPEKQFYSFIGAPFAPFENPATRLIAKNQWSQIFWKSEIHELALRLEYICLIRKN
ncbi:hypothetical protein [Lacihabitans sp. CCS-44]|uniref:hypothetical protein n=1 Tax=Lacihabitans sp. CCS-44 TaxID=2487331 RepID=UPI0020CC87FD|nr:hypothetical protein [Lacihabitans sp. CCS-44]